MEERERQTETERDREAETERERPAAKKVLNPCSIKCEHGMESCKHIPFSFSQNHEQQNLI